MKPTPDITPLIEDFPILARKVHGDKRLVYLDNAATTQKPQVVIDALTQYYKHSNSNVHRALHELAGEATEQYEASRKALAQFIGASSSEEVIFTRGTTEAINLVAYTWGMQFIGAGDEIVITEMEHHSNMIPWQRLAAEKGAKLRYVEVSSEGELNQEAYENALNAKPKLVAITHMSNLLGTILPVKEMTKQAHEAGAKVLLDAAQSAPHMPVNVQDLDCDFLALSGHKMCGPTGIGILYGRRALLEEMNPFMGGGEMILKVTWEGATWNDLPHKFEAGTPNIAGAIGLHAAVTYLQGVGLANIQTYTHDLAAYCVEQMDAIKGVKVVGHAASRGGAVSFDVAGVHPHDVAQYVDRFGVAIRGGHMCVQPWLKKQGYAALNRASVYFYNNRPDIDALVEAIIETQRYFDHG